MADSVQPGLQKHDLSTFTVVFMIFCLCAAGAYGIEEMIPAAGPGLTLVMLMVLPFVWSTPLGLVASELGSAIPEEGGHAGSSCAKSHHDTSRCRNYPLNTASSRQFALGFRTPDLTDAIEFPIL